MDKQWHADRSFSMLTPTFRMENEEPVFKETRLSFSNNRAIKNSTKLDKNTKNKKMDKIFANLKKGNIDKLTKIDVFDKSEQSILKTYSLTRTTLFIQRIHDANTTDTTDVFLSIYNL